ncbi:NADPH:quinone oxidoreductase-like [Bidens hawaiensis]|uniref:NADPH:quinone oxidoreductase-like n=1 Tax=Bidens hawaiensis TaxID=980011 RepID=UPI00404A52A7
MVYSIVMVAIWCLWNVRNKYIFENKPVKVVKVLGDIKIDQLCYVLKHHPCVVDHNGSLRKASNNGGLLRSAIELSKSIDGMTFEYVDISSLPMLNTDLEVDGIYPPVVEAFRQKILQFDGFLFASPEYNYSITAPLKNAIDWASRPPNVWATKPAAIISAGGGFGGARSHYHLRQIGVFLDLHFINKPKFDCK